MLHWHICIARLTHTSQGSDHCPVYAEFNDKVHMENKSDEVHFHDIMNPPGVFEHGQRLQEYSNRFLLPASGRLLPEFDVDKRRSIKDMFSRRPPAPSSLSATAANPTGKQGTDVTADSLDPPRPSPAAAPRKRPLPPSTSTAPKRSKSLATPTSSAPGQRSLKGFFKPKPSPVSSSEVSRAASQATDSSITQPTHGPSTAANPDLVQEPIQTDGDVAEGPAAPAFTDLVSNATPTKAAPDAVIDPAASKEDWSKLFTKKPLPLCDSHQEPCISLTTKKPGMNRGRAFWICPRPLGPSGEKEKGTQWRCPTFIWASDWNGSSQPET